MRTIVAVLLSLVPAVALAQDPYAQQPQYADPQYQQQDPQYQQQYQDPQYQGQQVDPSSPQYGFVGPHPEPYEYGNAPCYQPGAHFHPYPPFDQYLFRQANGYFYFIGDLGDFSYTGQLWGYQGNHPFPVENGGGFCYINWPHRHHFPAPASMPFRYTGGYYSYYGGWDPAYYANRDAWTGYYNGYYRSSYYGGRYWTVRPRPVYRPSYGWGAPGVYRPGVVVRSPSGVSVTVGPHYGGYGHPGYVSPGYARPGVVVGAPGYARPGVVVGAPGYARPGVVVGPPPARPQYVAPPSRPAPAPQRHYGSPGGVVVGPPR